MSIPNPLVTSSEEVMSGAVVFARTRVPVQTFLDYLEETSSIDEFLEDFPTVSREHAIAVLELAKESVFANAVPDGPVRSPTLSVPSSLRSSARVIGKPLQATFISREIS